MPDVFILDCILSDDQEQVSDEIHQMDELDFETFEPREDKNAGFKEVTRLQKVRHLDRSIGDSLKLLYDYRCQMTGERMRLSNKFWAVSFYSFNRLKNKLKK